MNDDILNIPDTIIPYNNFSLNYFSDFRNLLNKHVHLEWVHEWMNNSIKLIENSGKCYFITKEKKEIQKDNNIIIYHNPIQTINHLKRTPIWISILKITPTSSSIIAASLQASDLSSFQTITQYSSQIKTADQKICPKLHNKSMKSSSQHQFLIFHSIYQNIGKSANQHSALSLNIRCLPLRARVTWVVNPFSEKRRTCSRLRIRSALPMLTLSLIDFFFKLSP